MKFDHPWLPAVNHTISNAQHLLKIKIDEESNSISSLVKRGLITETLKFMIPFILGVAFAVYGIPSRDLQDVESPMLEQSSTDHVPENHPSQPQ